MNSNIRNTELKFFINFFLPLSQTIKKNAEKAEQVGRQVEAKNLRSYYYQIWDIFPGFCLYPTDLTEVDFSFFKKNILIRIFKIVIQIDCRNTW